MIEDPKINEKFKICSILFKLNKLPINIINNITDILNINIENKNNKEELINNIITYIKNLSIQNIKDFEEMLENNTKDNNKVKEQNSNNQNNNIEQYDTNSMDSSLNKRFNNLNLQKQLEKEIIMKC